MTLLAVGLSHRTAPVSVLETVSIGASDVAKVLDELITCECIGEVMLLTTCNRIEVIADVSRFHPAVAEISTVLARVAGVDVAALGEYLHVFFAEAAAEHTFRLTAGLDSMVVGESQIIGQVRVAYARGTEAGTVGRTLHELTQTALRLGKQAHSETGIDKAGASLVSVALGRASELLDGLTGRRVLVLGAGSMGALAAVSARRLGVGEIVVANRTLSTAARVATNVGGRAVPLGDATALHAELAAADLVITCTGSTGTVLGPSDLSDRDRPADGPPAGAHPLVIADIAMPHDVDPAVAAVPGVSYVDLEALREAGAVAADEDVAAAQTIIAAGLARYLEEQHALSVAPTVTALRARAVQVVEAEMRRLDGRLPELSVGERAEVAGAVRRAVDKVLHAPTVRVKELAATPDGGRYAAALRALFDLDPASAESVVSVRSAPAEDAPVSASDILAARPEDPS